MKYTKPNEAIARLLQSINDAWVYKREWKELLDFAQQFPDEFEIVEPGMTQVRWPESATKRELERLYQTYKNPYPIKFDRPIPYDEQLATVLYSLAAIAPVGKKKRPAELWLHVSGQKLWKYPDDNWRLNATDWRKVGECEVDA